MIRVEEPSVFLKCSENQLVADVRSPGEFLQGHLPGAVNIPLFSDVERAEIGTLYVKTGREEAIRRGFEIALPKKESYLELLRRSAHSTDILVHCWRGGLRSELMGDLFSRSGFEVTLLAGGYKAYRRHIREMLETDTRIAVIGGYTGSGKTELLRAIERLGEQVIDLEQLACHKGSVFGGLGQARQPTNEQFENDLFEKWRKLDLTRTIWLEDESRMIGRITLPEPLFEQISRGRMILVEMSVQDRINRLVNEYAAFDKEDLNAAITRISERLGGTRTREAQTALQESRFHDVASIVLAYYDKAYMFSIERRRNKSVVRLPFADSGVVETAKRLLDFV